jgi:putative lipoic acid-binding regulatory protein
MTKTSLVEFPCHFPIKIIGTQSQSFIDEIREIALKHYPNLNEEQISHKTSQNNNYLAITLTVYAENQQQLDDLYHELTQHPDVKMVL